MRYTSFCKELRLAKPARASQTQFKSYFSGDFPCLLLSPSTAVSISAHSLSPMAVAAAFRAPLAIQTSAPSPPAKDAAARAAQQFDQQFDREIVSDLSSEYTSACDLTPALRRFFAAVARGQAKPKAANTLAYLGQIMVQSIHLAQNQCIKAFGNRAGSKLSPATPTQRDAQPSRRRTKPRIRSQHQQPR